MELEQFMNKDKMELEEAIKNLRDTIKHKPCSKNLYCNNDCYECILESIETVLQALENLKEECRQYREFICVTGGKDIDDITATQYVRIQREGYLRGRKEEQEKARECILRLQENSIPKKKIKDIIERCKKNIGESKQDDLMFIDYMEDKITAYEELLEEK